MQLCIKIAAGLLLLVQAVHPASLQSSTDSPGRTIDKSWLRGAGKSPNTVLPEEESGVNQEADATAVESGNDYSGIASGSMAVYTEEGVANQDPDTYESSGDQTTAEPPTFLNVTTKQPEFPTTTEPTNSSQINMTDAEEEVNNSTMTPQNPTTQPSAQNSTGLPDYSNHTDLQTTTLAPEGNLTQESTTKPNEDTGLTNVTKSNNTTSATTTVTPEINETPTAPPSTTVFQSETTETIPATTTIAAPDTPMNVNKTNQGSASGSSSERALESDLQRSKRKGAWGAILGTAVAVACVGLVAYIILKKKHQKGFSHRKLVEEYPSDPVLRLDNNEPLDLNFGGSAYYNPALQGDNIQMSNLPGRR